MDGCPLSARSNSNVLTVRDQLLAHSSMGGCWFIVKGVAVPLQSGFSLGTPNEGTRETKRSMPCAAVQVVLLLEGKERERGVGAAAV